MENLLAKAMGVPETGLLGGRLSEDDIFGTVRGLAALLGTIGGAPM